jgi:glycosyltransferase 2 family protein
VNAAPRKWLAIALKLAATVVLLGFVLSRIEIGDITARLNPGRIGLALLAGAAVVALQSLLAAFRLQICVGLLGQKVGGFSAWTACQVGGLFSHTPMSFVGGDAMRVWHLARSGVGITEGAKSVLLDRALGFIGTMILVLLTSAGLYAAIGDPTMRNSYLSLVLAGAVAAFAFVALGRVRMPRPSNRVLGVIAEFATVSRYLNRAIRKTLLAVAIALLMSLLNVVAIWLIGAAYGMSANLLTTLIATPVVFLIAMIPISAAGWGLREGAFVVAFGLFGVPSAEALTISVTFGIAVLLAYSPAAVLLLLARRTAPAAKAEGYVPASSPPTGYFSDEKPSSVRPGAR